MSNAWVIRCLRYVVLASFSPDAGCAMVRTCVRAAGASPGDCPCVSRPVVWWIMDSILSLLGPRLLRKVLGEQLKKQAERATWMSDGQLHVMLPGTGSPLTDPTRAGPCAVVMAGGEYLVIDVGQGSYARQTTMGLPVGQITGILLTHFHSDHITELGETCTMSWANSGRREPLPVYGPPGVKEVVAGFRQAYEQDSHYRVQHHGHLSPNNWRRHGAFPTAVEIPLPGGSNSSMDSTLVFERNGLKVYAFNVDHKPVVPAYGYRFEYNGRVVTVSGDCCKCPQLLKYSSGADILVSEACSCHVVGIIGTNMKEQLGGEQGSRIAGIMTDIQDYHLDVQDVVDIAAAAKTPVLALTHLVPGTRGSWFLKKLWMARLRRPAGWAGKMYVGEDGDAFHLPAFSPAIEFVNVLTGRSDGWLTRSWSGRSIALLVVVMALFQGWRSRL